MPIRGQEHPLVSVLLPFRNASRTLSECLDSIRVQELEGFELLAIDDGSKDDSAQKVAQYAADNPDVRLLRPGRIGLVAALNLGLAEARAPLVARMDADDRMHPERLAAQKDILTGRADIALVGCQVRLFPGGQVRAGYQEYVRWQNGCLDPRDIADEIYVESPFAHPSVMFRRDAVLALGGYRDGDFPEDYDLWLRMHHAGLAMTKLPMALLDWRESPGRHSRRHPRYARAAFDRLRARYLARDRRLASRRPLAYWGAGRKTRARARHLIECGFPPVAWIDIDPRKVGNRIWGAPVHPPNWLAREAKPFVLVYVANHGARDDIGTRLQEMGYERGQDYLMVG